MAMSKVRHPYLQDIFYTTECMMLFSAFRKYGDMQPCMNKSAYLVLTSYPEHKTLAVPLDAIRAVRGKATVIRSTIRVLQVSHGQEIRLINSLAVYTVFTI